MSLIPPASANVLSILSCFAANTSGVRFGGEDRRQIDFDATVSGDGASSKAAKLLGDFALDDGSL